MKFSPQSRIAILIATYIVVGFILAIVIVETQSIAFVIIFCVWFIMANFLLGNVKCPMCGESIVNQNTIEEKSFLARVFKAKCSSCGCDLTKKRD